MIFFALQELLIYFVFDWRLYMNYLSTKKKLIIECGYSVFYYNN